MEKETKLTEATPEIEEPIEVPLFQVPECYVYLVIFTSLTLFLVIFLLFPANVVMGFWKVTFFCRFDSNLSDTHLSWTWINHG